MCIEQLVRAGARKMLQDALEAEVDDFLGRRRYQRTEDKRGNRNGHLPERTIGVGMGAVEVKLPHVSDVPTEVSPAGFHSEIVSRYQRRSRTQARLMARLYLEGLSSGDFEPVFRALVGETAALSPSSILKLKADWQQEYEAWKRRPLRGRYVYLYADGLSAARVVGSALCRSGQLRSGQGTCAPVGPATRRPARALLHISPRPLRER